MDIKKEISKVAKLLVGGTANIYALNKDNKFHLIKVVPNTDDKERRLRDVRQIWRDGFDEVIYSSRNFGPVVDKNMRTKLLENGLFTYPRGKELAASVAVELKPLPVNNFMQGIKQDYMIYLHGKPFCKLYFNMKGYRAEFGIPFPADNAQGFVCLDIGEKGLTNFKSEITKANKEWSKNTK